MSEYIEIETEPGGDPGEMVFNTNLQLAPEEAERYDSPAEMDEGSPLAQALTPIDGITALRIEGRKMTVSRDLAVPWHVIVAEISAALKDFFL
jgi:hypothetical protein